MDLFHDRHQVGLISYEDDSPRQQSELPNLLSHLRDATDNKTQRWNTNKEQRNSEET